jgi:hypothetical protein
MKLYNWLKYSLPKDSEYSGMEQIDDYTKKADLLHTKLLDLIEALTAKPDPGEEMRGYRVIMDGNDYGASANRFYDVKNFLRDSDSNMLLGSGNVGPFFREEGLDVWGSGGVGKEKEKGTRMPMGYAKSKSVIFRGVEFGFNYMTDISKTPNLEEKTFGNYDYLRKIKERDSDRREKFMHALGGGLGHSMAVEGPESSEIVRPRKSLNRADVEDIVKNENQIREVLTHGMDPRMVKKADII